MIDLDDDLTQFRIVFENCDNAKISICSLFTAVDTRQQITNFCFIQGSCDYLNWTGDINFLREQIQRMRLALHYILDEFKVEKYNCVFVPWIGHNGKSGIVIDSDGKKTIRYGQGLGGTYYDIIPFGAKDGFSSIYLYNVLNLFADLDAYMIFWDVFL